MSSSQADPNGEETTSPASQPTTPAQADGKPAGERAGQSRDLRLIFSEGVAWSVMVGVGETYLAAFALALGMGQVASGLVSTLPMVAGGILQLLTPTAVRRLGSRRRWVVICATTQALSFAPLIVLAIAGHASTWLVFLVASIYWGSGMAAGPAWNPWVGTLVPRQIRMRYFANRTRATQVGTVVGLVGGGISLDFFRHRDQELLGFATLFLIAAAARAVSARLLVLHSEPEPPRSEQMVGVREIIPRLRHSDDGRFLLFLVCMTTAVTVSSPFFTPYMLRQLDLSYAGYMGLVATAFLAKIVTLSILGTHARGIGARRLLRLGTAGIIPVSAMWLVSGNYLYLVFLQLLSGAMWSIFELATFLLFFEAIRENERTSLLTTFNLVNTIGAAAGSILGGLVLAGFPGPDGYFAIFAGSSAARLIIGILLLRLGSGRAVQMWMVLRTIGVRPSSGGILHPILPGMGRSESKDRERTVDE
jgi:MFS family permease